MKNNDCMLNCEAGGRVDDFEKYLCSETVERNDLLVQAIGEIVVGAFGAHNSGLWDRHRGDASIALARQVSMYLAHVVCGLNFTQIGVAFRRDRTTVSHACCVVEDRRDDQNFDRKLDTLEHGILCLLDTGLYTDLSETSGGVVYEN